MKFFLAISILLYSLSVLAAGEDFIYLAPKSVPSLPSYIVSTLEKEKCLVPKWSFEFGGVTKGEFAKSGQTDTAVICTQNNSSKILIFWGGPSKCPSKIDSIGQFISTVDKKYILDHYAAYGGNKPPEITHHAINDIYVEKASIVKYCHNGKWIELTGAD